MTDKEYRPPLADFFDHLEAKYGDASGEFMFDSLTDDELVEVERLGQQAIYDDPNVTSQEKINLQPLLQLVAKQRAKRGLPSADT